MECPRCHKGLCPSDSSHYARHHLRLTKIVWPCHACSFQSLTFSDSLTHCFLDGHSVVGNQKSGPSNIATAHKSTQFETSLSNQATQREQISHSTRSNMPAPSIPVPTALPNNAIKNRNPIAESTILLDADSLLIPESVDDSLCSEEETADIESSQVELSLPSLQQDQTDMHVSEMGAVEDVDNSEPDDEDSFSEEEEPVAPTKQNQSAGRISCEICWKSMQKARGLPRHVLYCLALRPYKCTRCSASFTEIPVARRHLTKECIGSELRVENRAETEAAVRAGIRTRFPTVNVKWSGLSPMFPDLD